MNNLKPFKWFCMQNFPFIEADYDASTEWQLLQEIGMQCKDLTGAVLQIQKYLDTLDLQDEVNNKLDEMAESGQLEEIIGQYLALKITYTFKNVSEMLSSENLIDGSYAQTLGFYTKNDGGKAKYYIREITNEDNIDNMFLFALTNSETLIAEKLEEEMLNVKSIGAYGDGVHDDTNVLSVAFNSGKTVYIPNGEYIQNSRIDITSSVKIIGENKYNTKIVNSDNIAGDFSSFIYSENINNISVKNLTFDGGTQTVSRHILNFINCHNLELKDLYSTGGLGYVTRLNNSNNITVKNCEFDTITGVDGNPGGGIYGQNLKNTTIENCRGNLLDDHLVYIAGIDLAENINIANCDCYKSGNANFTAGASIVLYGNIQNANITNCNFDTCPVGIDLKYYTFGGEIVGAPKHVNITNCNFKDSKDAGIYMEGTTDNLVQFVTISNCNIYNVTVQDGISVRYCKQVNIINSILNTIVRNGIDVRNSELINICENIIKNTTLGILTGYDTTTANKIFIKNNIIDTDSNYTGSHQQGIYVRNTSTNCVVENNSIDNCTGFYISVTGTGHIVRNQSINNDNGTTTSCSLLYGSATPTTGTFKKGDIVINSNATVGSPKGWICTTAGTPRNMDKFRKYIKERLKPLFLFYSVTILLFKSQLPILS